MKTNIFLTIALLTTTIWCNLFSQTSVPQIGAIWYYSAYSGSGPGEGYYQMEYIADVEKGGKICKQMKIKEMDIFGKLSPEGSYDYLLYEDRKIYHYIDYYDNLEPDFYLLYDFNVKEGEQIHTSYPFYDSQNKIGKIDHFTLTVSEIKDTIINGEILACYKFRNEDYFNGTSIAGFDGIAIENIGNISHSWFFPIEHYHTNDFWLPRNFRCYTNQDFHLKSETLMQDCDYFSPIGAVKHHRLDQPPVFLQDRNTLCMENLQEAIFFSIVDAQGKKQLQGYCSGKIDITSLPVGLYLLKTQTVNIKFTKH